MPLATHHDNGAEKGAPFTVKLGKRYWQEFTWQKLVKSHAHYINNTKGLESLGWRLLALLLAAPIGAVVGLFWGAKKGISGSNASLKNMVGFALLGAAFGAFIPLFKKPGTFIAAALNTFLFYPLGAVLTAGSIVLDVVNIVTLGFFAKGCNGITARLSGDRRRRPAQRAQGGSHHGSQVQTDAQRRAAARRAAQPPRVPEQNKGATSYVDMLASFSSDHDYGLQDNGYAATQTTGIPSGPTFVLDDNNQFIPFNHPAAVPASAPPEVAPPYAPFISGNEVIIDVSPNPGVNHQRMGNEVMVSLNDLDARETWRAKITAEMHDRWGFKATLVERISDSSQNPSYSATRYIPEPSAPVFPGYLV